ncbi:MAG: putative heme-binding domain-containing protein [Verrucomicrobiales bacterium]|jgi:putative heme-binding domain-containing protein
MTIRVPVVSLAPLMEKYFLHPILALILAATATAKVPDGLVSSRFSGPDITPSPACLCAAPTGEVFVGVDMNGSLGKEVGRGRIVRLIDNNNDGKADRHTVFAEIDDPRGLISVGRKLFVLHTVIPADTGILSGMHLSLLTDDDWDGVADGEPRRLISNISVTKHNQDRGADHTTNGIRMGIDGWIYIAIGDFGFVDAEGADGRKLTMLGGGVVRVRPDGTEMEVYTHGLRNIYDVAIDPYMNLYTRGNTNDGGGWNVRFAHHVQSGEYGYPVLFKNFTDEILPALVDAGGGSGTGALFMQEPGWPEQFNNVPMMCDWGRSHLYIHRLTPDGASFIQEQEDFIKLSQIADLDVDGSSRAYLAAWDGAGYKGSSEKGYIDRVVPEKWNFTPFPDLRAASTDALVAMLGFESATGRLHAQRELLDRPTDASWRAVAGLALDKKAPLYARVAAIFTYKQLRGDEATAGLTKLTSDPTVREFALRAMADRGGQMQGVTLQPYLDGLTDPNPRVKVAAAVGLGRIGRPEAAPALLAIAFPISDPPAIGSEGPHATPNSAAVVPHVAIRALVALNAVEETVSALSGPNRPAALWALRYMHDTRAVEGLMSAYAEADSSVLQQKILTTLIRLSHKEQSYDGTWWWGTRPDTRGPYYKLKKWQASDDIELFIRVQWDNAEEGSPMREFLTNEVTRHRSGYAGIERTDVDIEREEKIDLGKVIGAGAGEVGSTSIEDVILAVAEIKGNPRRGRKLFTQQGCVACHTLKKDEPLKGPFMGHVGSIMKRDQIAESILKPNASISQGFATALITTNDGNGYTGFISKETADEIELRDIAGNVHTLKAGDIANRQELEISMMPPALANALSLKDFASLLAFLERQKE